MILEANQNIAEEEVIERRTVHFLLRSRYIGMEGTWRWPLHCDAVFCSDVMLAEPPFFFEGTRGLLHPDDRAEVEQLLLRTEEDLPLALRFRIITTYGEVRTLDGEGLRAVEKEILPVFHDSLLDQAAAEKDRQVELNLLRARLRAASLAEKYGSAGSWYFDLSTYEVAYSDHFYHLHGLMPQSLKAHLKTFDSFLHPEDRGPYSEAFDKAFRDRLPLHLTYRIIDALGRGKVLQLCTDWHFTQRGAPVLSAVVLDVTEAEQKEAERAQTAAMLKYREDRIRTDESLSSTGTWEVNLFTRKWVWSDQSYRIFGLKPQAVPLNFDVLLGFIHPEDREPVTHTFREMQEGHSGPDIEFRILRGDGKTRHLLFRGKPVMNQRSEQMMAGILKDQTVVRLQEKRERKMRRESAALQRIRQAVESAAGVCVWVTDLQEGTTTWSDTCHTLLGYKPRMLELNEKLFLHCVHPEDKKPFREALHAAVQRKEERTLLLRITTKGVVKYLKAHLNIITDEGKELMVATLVDISAEQGLRQELTDRRQIAEAIRQAVGEMIFLTDRSHTITELNHSLRDPFGRKDLQAEGRNLFEVFPKLRQPAFLEHLQKALEGRTVRLTSSPLLRHENGGTHTLIPLFPKDGTAARVLHVVHDKNEEKELRQQLAVHARLMELIAEQASGRVIVMDRNMNYVCWNSTCEQHYRLRKEEVIGRNILEITPGFYDDPSYNALKKALGGTAVHLPAHPEASGKCFETMLLPVSGDDGQVTHVLWLMQEPATVPHHMS